MSGPEPTDSDEVTAESDGASDDASAGSGSASDGTSAESGSVTDGNGSSPALSPSRAAVADRLSTCESVLEVGIGRRPGVAAALAVRGVDVTAVDIHDRSVPDGIRFLRDDIVERAAQLSDGGSRARTVNGANGGDAAHYRVDAIYALNLPPELQRPTRTVARAVDAACLFTTLGGDPATVPATAASLGRETLYVARD